MIESHVLRVDMRRRTVHWGERQVPTGQKWFEVFHLCALRYGTDDPWVTREDIALLEPWRRTRLSSIGANLRRKCDELEQAGCAVLMTPPRGRTRALALDPARVSGIEILGERAPEPLPAAEGATESDEAFHAALLLAERHFERGEYVQALERCAALQGDPRPDRAVRVLALRAWTLALHQPLGNDLRVTLSRLRRAHDAYANSEDARHPDRQDDAARLRTLYWVQLGRVDVLRGDLLEMQRCYAEAAQFVTPHDHRAHVALLAGSALMDRQAGLFGRAEQQLYSAIDHARQAHWMWGLHAQYNNLGSLHLAWARHASSPEGRERRLAEGLRWLTRSAELALAYGFGGQVNLLANLVTAFVEQGRPDRAREVLDTGERLAAQWGQELTGGMLLLAKADFLIGQDQHPQARKAAAEALRVFRKLDNPVQQRVAREKLAEVAARLAARRNG